MIAFDLMKPAVLSLIAAPLLWGCADRAPTAPFEDSPPAISHRDPARQADGGSSAGRGRPTVPFVPGQMVVDLSDGMNLDLFHARWSTETLLELEAGYALVSVPENQSVWDLSIDMVESGDCAVAQPNYELESPEANQGVVAFVETNHIFSDLVDQNAYARIGLPQAQTVATGLGVVVAIVDTGIDATHPDLAGAVLSGRDFVDDDFDAADEADGIDQDGDGFADEAAGHGTHVAGIIRAIAPDAQLLPVRVLDSEGLGTSVWVARGIRWAAQQGVDVINLSLGMQTAADVVKDAIRDAEEMGIFVASSAGNRGIADSHHFPAKLSDVAAVAATDPDDLKADFSSYGSYVSMSAPGEGILSTYLDHAYAVWSGTSFSTPMVSAGAALRRELSPGDTRDETADAIEETAAVLDHASLPYEGKMGAGRLDLAALTSL